MTEDLDKSYLLHLAEEAVLFAGHHLKHNRPGWKQVEKTSDHDVKILADRISEDLIVKQLKRGSNIKIFSEESGYVGCNNEKGERKNKSELYWIIDPLDGSLNYHKNIPFCCISIALYKGKNAILGVVYDFVHDELFNGIVGEGAWLNQHSINTSQICEISDAVLGTGFPVNTDFSSGAVSNFVGQIQQYRKVRLLGSAAISLCFVACGRLDSYQEENIMFWDIAAGCALVQSAGGKVHFDIRDGNIHDPVTVIAHNGQLSMF